MRKLIGKLNVIIILRMNLTNGKIV